MGTNYLNKLSRSGAWKVSKSALNGHFAIPKGWESSGYFYLGPTAHFGHYPPKKGGKKRN